MRVLHAGAGFAGLPPWLVEGEKDVEEVRLDIDPVCEPDVVGSLTDLGDIGEFDRIYCSHCLEHLHSDEVQVALKEFYRVLKPGGSAVINVPDLEGVRPTKEVLYISVGGLPITGLDILFGYRGVTKAHPYMMHRTGFISETFQEELENAGFSKVTVRRMNQSYESYNLMGVVTK